MAIGALAASREIGLEIPEQLSLIGFDDITLASMVVPKLTTVAQPKRDLGETGAKLLFQQITKDKKQEAVVLLQPNLVIRDSTAPPHLK